MEQIIVSQFLYLLASYQKNSKTEQYNIDYEKCISDFFNQHKDIIIENIYKYSGQGYFNDIMDNLNQTHKIILMKELGIPLFKNEQENIYSFLCSGRNMENGIKFVTNNIDIKFATAKLVNGNYLILNNSQIFQNYFPHLSEDIKKEISLNNTEIIKNYLQDIFKKTKSLKFFESEIDFFYKNKIFTFNEILENYIPPNTGLIKTIEFLNILSKKESIQRMIKDHKFEFLNFLEDKFKNGTIENLPEKNEFNPFDYRQKSIDILSKTLWNTVVHSKKINSQLYFLRDDVLQKLETSEFINQTETNLTELLRKSLYIMLLKNISKTNDDFFSWELDFNKYSLNFVSILDRLAESNNSNSNIKDACIKTTQLLFAKDSSVKEFIHLVEGQNSNKFSFKLIFKLLLSQSFPNTTNQKKIKV